MAFSAVLRRLAVAAVVVLPLGCSGSEETIPPLIEPTTTTTAATAPTTTVPATTTTTDPNAPLLTVVKNYWAVYDAAGARADASYAPLRQVSTGRQLEHLQKLFAEQKAKNEVFRGETQILSLEVRDKSPDQAVVWSCTDGEGVYDSVTGERIDSDSPPRRTGHLLVLEDGVWKTEWSSSGPQDVGCSV